MTYTGTTHIVRISCGHWDGRGPGFRYGLVFGICMPKAWGKRFPEHFD